MTTRETRKLGRLARTFEATIPYLREIVRDTHNDAPPDACDWVSAMPQFPGSFGMMLNDKLGDCMCAAFYHARQVWTYHATGTAEVASDDTVERLYERACGYKKTEPGEGPGGNVRRVLAYIHTHGAPTGPTSVDKIVGFFELDLRNHDEIKRAIVHGGVAYLGFDMPAHISPPVDPVPAIWDVVAAEETLIGGHAVVAAAYDARGLTVISWGYTYTMTWAFFEKYVDEAYVIADRTWHESAMAAARGLTLPGNLSAAAIAQKNARRLTERLL